MTDSKHARPWEQIGISKSWYYSIKGRHRPPSMGLALRIYDQLGLKLGPIEGLAPDDINAMRKALHKSSAPIAMTAANQLQNDDGELRCDSPLDRVRKGNAKDQPRHEGS